MDYNLELLNRDQELFKQELKEYDKELKNIVSSSSFLVIGAAGSIGQAVTKEIFKRDPQVLHVVDINENNMVELVRDIRSSLGYIKGDFKTYAIDCNSVEFDAMFSQKGPYDYVLNLSALKHVRSEKDPYTMMRMIDTNILNIEKTLIQSVNSGVKKYFCVSTDKAANPVNIMGASKSIMEMYLMFRSLEIPVSTARFANVAFSEGSLLQGFFYRIQKKQPISAPKDVRRYFITAKESGILCLLSCLLGNNRDIFFPKLNDKLHLITFAEIAVNYLAQLGYEAVVCETESEARQSVKILAEQKKWPCYFFNSDTTGEKDFEVFYTDHEYLDMDRFKSIGIIISKPYLDYAKLENFANRVAQMKYNANWSREDLVKLFHEMIPGFAHQETGRFLDGKM